MGTVVIVTGSRNWHAVNDVYRDLDVLNPTFLVLGDCKTGVDKFALEYAEARSVPHFVCKAEWTMLGRKAGPIRNGHMVQLGKELASTHGKVVCLGFPIGSGRSGTRDCMGQAKSAKVQVLEHGTHWAPLTPPEGK